jgi:glycosyltransferase involved in cell wall biosynthesis
MINGQRLIVVMPAYRAARTLEATFRDLPHDVVDRVLLVDDASNDDTVAVARRLGIEVHVHAQNRGYGGNQKTCYTQALAAGADIVVMVHPDYQYEPRLVTAMAGMVASGVYDAVLGSRILGGQARAGGMPWWKYVANRLLTATENLMLGAKLSEYHTGYRAYSRSLLEQLRWRENSDDFVFDNQFLAQCILGGFRIGEISVPTKYFDEASSINFTRSVRYGLGVLHTSWRGLLWRSGLRRDPLLTRLPPAGDGAGTGGDEA